MWSTIDDRTICRFTSDAKDKPVSKYHVQRGLTNRCERFFFLSIRRKHVQLSPHDTVVSTFDCSISLLPAFLLHSVSALFWRQACRRSFHSFSTDCNIAISTYSMVSFTGKRSWEAGEVRENKRHPSLHARFIPLVLFSA